MENPDFFDDEVVADSEEEIDPNMSMDRSMAFLGHGSNQTSSVSAFTTAGYPQLKPFSAISNFTGDTSARPPQGDSLPEDDAGGSNQRRPGQADTSVSSINNTFTDFEGMSVPGNIADRAKMRQRTQKKTVVDTSDVIELTSEDEDDEIGIISFTSKTRPAPKPKTKLKAKQKAKGIYSEDIETPSVSTKASLPPKPRPRPVPIRKRPKLPQDAAPATSTPGPELPIATSPPRMPLPNQMVTSHLDSQLPPSDPPMSTFMTEHSKENEAALPRIETLPKIMPGEGPLSSPSSLFSDAGINAKKRPGRSGDSDAEIDELAPSDEGPVGYYQSERSLLLRKMPPPPTFFAGSSSLPTDEGEGNVFPARSDPYPDIVDLTDLPPTMVPTTKSKPSPKTKKSKTKKKTSNYDEYDDFAAPMLILDEDEQDDDFDPSGDGEKKKKGKAKEKKAKSKPKTPKANPNGAKVEVLITTKPPKAKTKKKSDAKTKEKESVKGDKEVFKSREFIEDSDGDDPLQLVEGSSASRGPHTSSGPSAQERDTASSSDKLTITIPAVQSPSALPDPVEPSSPLSELDMPKSKSSKSKKATGKNKRKSIVDSDHEEELEEVQKDETPSKSKKRKTDESGKIKGNPGSNRKGKAKQIVVSEEEEESFDMDTEETALQAQVKDLGQNKSSNMILDEEEDNQSDDEDPKVGHKERTSKSRDAGKSSKENAAPTMSKPLIAATPKLSRPLPLNNDGTTPLYARYEIAPRRSSLPMSELIRRANSMPGSPFSTPNTASASASTSLSKSAKLKPLLARTPSSTAYSPYLKSSRSLLSKIAPLHPNRRTPPPPPPPPPPRKKSKKELELEAKWEEEMIEDAGGMEAWVSLQDEERKEMRKMKWARELGGWDD